MREPDWIDLYLGPASVAFLLGVGMACVVVGGTIAAQRINHFADTHAGLPRFALHLTRFLGGLLLAAILSFAWLYELLSIRVALWELLFLFAGAVLAASVLIRAGVFKASAHAR